jgi:hypothetical protein
VADSSIARGGLDFDFAFRVWLPSSAPSKEELLARKTVLVCDNCGKEVGENKGATMRLTYSDARRGAKAADLCDDCAGGMPGHAAARRGRKPKAAAA